MRTYTVTEIATLFNVDKETVIRWVDDPGSIDGMLNVIEEFEEFTEEL